MRYNIDPETFKQRRYKTTRRFSNFAITADYTMNIMLLVGLYNEPEFFLGGTGCRQCV